ncbi:GNAT family N-acetyltransferase [Pseudomonas oryzihabitans]|uniref:GNAT family N-acetyltransferase n=1 Tax=Pseudomonas oryzihabitans TaxID=47885 RepID=UPI002893D30E|nr:GNAT family N-acetyltransferase [Pseudomonas oryzihabitans]MDT3718093.1 GNAT family N-acetyltransferase [Pseudomonas oryzihabitans]
MKLREGGTADTANDICIATSIHAEAVTRGFAAFVSAQHPGLADESADLPIRLVITEATGVIAGLLGRVFWEGLEIEVLWVADAHRCRGLGQRLLQRAEADARVLGARVAYLRTAHAAAFYERCGYRHCGYLPRPLGTGLHSFYRELS